MDQSHNFIPHQLIPTWRDPTEARHELERIMERFIKAAAEEREKVQESALTVKVSAGVGKTSTALRLLERHGSALLERGHVFFYVPTLDLAERAAADLVALDPKLPVTVIRGRLAKDPETAKPMCARPELVEEVRHLVPSVTAALCRREDWGKVKEAPCAKGCPYLAQKSAVGAKIHFLSHQYLKARPPICMDPKLPIALRIVDEKVWPSLISVTDIYVEDFLRAPCPGFPDELLPLLSIAKVGIVTALQNGLDVRTHLASLGIGWEKLGLLAEGEKESVKPPDIRPNHGPDKIQFILDTFERSKFFAARKRQSLFDLLASDKSLGVNRLTIEDLKGDAGQRQVIRLYRLNEIKRDAPLLMLDADADAAIAEMLAPGTDFERIETKPQAEIVQISDRTLSNTWLLDAQHGKKRRAVILGIIEREVERAADLGVLVVATRPVLAQLHADVGQPINGNEDDEGWCRLLLGATPRWFGPKMLGVNDFERYKTIITIGRMQPGTEAIEQQARCLFGIVGDTALDPLKGALPEQSAIRIMADGSVRDATIRTHPDPQVAVVLGQSRECGTLQAIARLRLASPDKPKRVVVLCNMPLTDLPVTKLVTLQALSRDLEDERDIIGFIRIDRALRATMGKLVSGTRLSAAGLAEDLPRDFSSLPAAKDFRRGRSTPDLQALIGRVAGKNGWPLTYVELEKPKGGGRPIPAVILDRAEAAVATAERLWPGFNAQVILT